MRWWKPECKGASEDDAGKVNIPAADEFRKEYRKDWEDDHFETRILGAVVTIQAEVDKYKRGSKTGGRWIYHVCESTAERNYVAGRFIDAGYNIDHEGPHGLRLKISW